MNFGEEKELFAVESLLQGDFIPGHGCIYSQNHDLLAISHWDSHCTFLCGSQADLVRILSIDKFEGFWCTEQTEVYWGLYPI